MPTYQVAFNARVYVTVHIDEADGDDVITDDYVTVRDPAVHVVMASGVVTTDDGDPVTPASGMTVLEAALDDDVAWPIAEWQFDG